MPDEDAHGEGELEEELEGLGDDVGEGGGDIPEKVGVAVEVTQPVAKAELVRLGTRVVLEVNECVVLGVKDGHTFEGVGAIDKDVPKLKRLVGVAVTVRLAGPLGDTVLEADCVNP